MALSRQNSQMEIIDYLQFLSDMGVETVPKRKKAAPTGKAASERTAIGRHAKEITADRSPVVAAPSAKIIDITREGKMGRVQEIIPPVIDSDLDCIRADIGDCRRCKLCDRRNHIVFGVGNTQARVMFVGEAPGADEDMQGIPFVGRAGKLLTKIIEAIKFSRDQVYIANVVKCRPPDNRTPETDEIAACQGFLFRQIAVLRPWIICALGAPSAQTLLGIKLSIGQLRGKWHSCRGSILIPTYHPSYLLRNPIAKRDVWEDVKMLRSRYESLCQEKGVEP